MKKYMIFIIIGLLIGCDTESTETLIIHGVWNLKNVTGGFSGINIDYSTGDVQWNFKTDGTLIIDNTILTTGPENIYAGLDSGTYNYVIEHDGEMQTLFVNTVKRGIINQINNTLQIDDDVAADGFLTEFER